MSARPAFCALSLAAVLAAVASGCGGSGDRAASFEPSAPAPPTTSTQLAAPAPPPAVTVPIDASSDPRAATIASRLTAAGYTVRAFAERVRRSPDDGPRTAQDFEHAPRALLTVTDPDDDRKVERLRRQLFAVDSAVSRQGTMETAAQAARIQQLVAEIQNQFRVEVAVYGSAADAAADRRDARQPFVTGRDVQLVTQAKRKGAVVYRLTVAEELGDRYDDAFSKVVAAGQGA